MKASRPCSLAPPPIHCGSAGVVASPLPPGSRKALIDASTCTRPPPMHGCSLASDAQNSFAALPLRWSALDPPALLLDARADWPTEFQSSPPLPPCRPYSCGRVNSARAPANSVHHEHQRAWQSHFPSHRPLCFAPIISLLASSLLRRPGHTSRPTIAPASIRLSVALTVTCPPLAILHRSHVPSGCTSTKPAALGMLVAALPPTAMPPLWAACPRSRPANHVAPT